MKTEINGHDIIWSADNKRIKELDGASIMHLEDMVSQGYTSGELFVSYGKNGNKETRGWWEVVNWQSIALELYNANTPEKVKAARKRFDENWS